MHRVVALTPNGLVVSSTFIVVKGTEEISKSSQWRRITSRLSLGLDPILMYLQQQLLRCEGIRCEIYEPQIQLVYRRWGMKESVDRTHYLSLMATDARKTWCFRNPCVLWRICTETRCSRSPLCRGRLGCHKRQTPHKILHIPQSSR